MEQHESCEPPVKLFVGQIPKDLLEEALNPYFEEFGSIKELTIIRDSNNVSKGCAFVSYFELDAAERAIASLHEKVKLPNAFNPLQVRLAETQVDKENKVFVGMLPKTFTEEDLQAMFQPFGELREVHVIRGPEGSPKGCAFIKFVNRDSALSAIEELNETIPNGATRPLVVKFADTKKTGPSTRRSDQVEFGYQSQHPISNSSNSGSGLMKPASSGWFSGRDQFVDSRDNRMIFPYSTNLSNTMYDMSPMGFSPAYQHNVYGNLPSRNTNQMSGRAGMVSGGFNDVNNSTQSGSHLSHHRPPEGPNGANLFIYHLPRDITDADLATLFAPFGNVISAKVFVDKKTSDSKGFGFVSYDSFESANSAIESMNGFQIGSKRLKVQHKKVSQSQYQDESMFNIRSSNQGNYYDNPPNQSYQQNSGGVRFDGGVSGLHRR